MAASLLATSSTALTRRPCSCRPDLTDRSRLGAATVTGLSIRFSNLLMNSSCFAVACSAMMSLLRAVGFDLVAPPC